jgi:predicted molibdopterin-dependent oxidoreductase YjgC
MAAFRSCAANSGPTVRLNLFGREVLSQPGISVAAALLLAGERATRNTPVSAEPRGPFCLMGACFECLVTIDGKDDQRSCMHTVCDGMHIERPGSIHE